MSASKPLQEDIPPDGASDTSKDQEKESVVTTTRSSGGPYLKSATATTAPPAATNKAATFQNPFRHQLQPPDKDNISAKARPRYRQHFPGFDRAMMAVNEEEETVNNNNNNSIHNNERHQSRRRRSFSPTHTNNSVASSAVLNRSHASSSSDSGSSTLNLSIGARAALNEHLRYIARFGLDGSANNSSNNNSNSSQNNVNNNTSHSSGNVAHGHPPRSRSSTPPRNPLDVMWDTLLSEDGETNLFSPGSPSPSLTTATAQEYEHEREEHQTTEPFIPEGGLNLSKIEVSVSSGDIDGSEAIEVSPSAISAEETNLVVPKIEAQHQEPKEPPPPISLFPWDHHNHRPYDGSHHATDCDNQSKSSKSSSSFFNSSRVEQLRTPERNFTMNEGEAGVTQRHFDYAPHSPSILEESTICGSDGPSMDNIPMAHMFRAFTTGGIASTTERAGISSTTTSPGQKEGRDASSPSPTPSFLDHSFSSFVMGATDLSRISGFGNSPDNSFQRDTSFPRDNPHQSHPHAQNRPLFSSWDEEDNPMPLQEHPPFDRPYLDGPSPPPAPPPSRSTRQGNFYPTQNPPSSWQNTSFSSLPLQRIIQHHRSLSPPRRRPLLQKQHSCPVSGESYGRHNSRRSDSSHHNTRYDLSSGRWHSHKPKPAAVTRPVFSEVAQNAGWAALTQEREQQEQASSPPTQTLMDFFQDYSQPANDGRAIENHDLASLDSRLQRQHDPNLPLFSSPSRGVHNTQEPSLDEISTIQNDSSSGGQQNISSSSSSNRNKQWRKVQMAGSNQPNSKPAAITTTPATAVLNRSTLSSSSTSSTIHPVDRRLYRTVVPSRVFLTEEPKEGYFPRARDSFSSDDPGRKVGRSTSNKSSNRRQQQQLDDDDEESCLLQDSFEAAHQHSLLEESRKLEQQQEEH